MEIKEQIKQKMENDAAFAAALKEAKNGEEVTKAFQAAGFQLTEEELKGMFQADGTALSDEELDNVAGGLYLCQKADGKWHFDLPHIKYGQMIVPEED